MDKKLKKTTKKLIVSTVTIRRLTNDELSQIHGASGEPCSKAGEDGAPCKPD